VSISARRIGLIVVQIMAVMVGLYLARLYNYLLFHTLVELFAVLVAGGIFVIAWNARRFMANNYLLFVGIASLFVGVVDLLHALAYKGMAIFPGDDANLATQLWIGARYLQASALLVAPFFLKRTLQPRLTVGIYLGVVVLLLSAIFAGAFPVCFVEGSGLTPFKKGSEYLIVLFLGGALVGLRRAAAAFDRAVVTLLAAGIGLFIAAELAFTLYTDVYGIANLAGHFLKFAGFFLVYKAIIETALTRPYDLLFRELKAKQEEIETLNADLAARADELEEANCELEATLADLESANLELEATNRELESANLELEAFNYTVSHDLRTPLTGISGYCQILTLPGLAVSNEEGKGFIFQISAAAERMNQMINSLLDFSRLTRGALHRSSVDLSQLAIDVAAELRLSTPARRGVFTIGPGLTADGDPKLLRVVLENLFGNAWKYSGKRDEAVIAFGRRPGAGEAVWFVRDNGAGFDMTKAAKMFAPFQRCHPGAEFSGSGIGLATVKRIVERHGGRIWAEGEPDKGATFYFTLG